MDAKGLGRKLLLTPSGDPHRTPGKQTVGTVTASQKMLSLQALSSSQCRHCEERLPGPRKGFLGDLRNSVPPKGPRPFTHYRFNPHLLNPHLRHSKPRLKQVGYVEPIEDPCAILH